MKVLYISALASRSTIDEIRLKYPDYSGGFAAQKFNRLVVEGFALNGVNAKALSTFYLPSVDGFWHHKQSSEDGVVYKYIPSPSISALRHLWVIIFTFFYVLCWGAFNRKNKFLACDVLNVSACIGALGASKLIGLKHVGIVTDIPGLRPGSDLKDLSHAAFSERLNMRFLSKFSHYVFLTKQMNEVLNPLRRPYMVMEGLVDINMSGMPIAIKAPKKVILYAGAIREGFGLKLLVEGFINANVQDSELWLFGEGTYVEDIKEYARKDGRIRYFGTKPNEEIVRAEMQATLLVNPRPTHEDYTRYSFPSKNMEYMVSGTPLLTTKLPGMPTEYHQYVYLFDDGEDIEAYSHAIKRLLEMPIETLEEKGKKAMLWVLENKNNKIQAKRILDFIKSN